MKEKEEKVAAERKKKEDMQSLLACKHFGCNARYKAEDNHAQSCVYHESPPIFHETAKWWSCCPQKKAYDWETFQAIPGCLTGEHTNIDPKTKHLGGSDLREKTEVTKLKSIDDYNAGDDKPPAAPAKPLTNQGKIEAAKESLALLGVDKELFDEVYESYCAKHEVQDLSKDLWKVSKEFGETFNAALKKAKEESA